MKKNKLFMLLLGASMPGRHTEQHDVFFGIAENLRELLPDIQAFWPEAGRKLHIDAWREIKKVNEYEVIIEDRATNTERLEDQVRLFFINLGGYRENEFEEFHYKVIAAGNDKGEAIKKAKQTAFYQHYNMKGAESHIDDKYGLDVDDLYEITDILPAKMKSAYKIILAPAAALPEDEVHLGYLTLAKLEQS